MLRDQLPKRFVGPEQRGFHVVVQRELSVCHAPPPFVEIAAPRSVTGSVGAGYHGARRRWRSDSTRRRSSATSHEPPIPEDEGVLARLLVVVAAHAFDVEPQAFVQRARGVVRLPDLERRAAGAVRRPRPGSRAQQTPRQSAPPPGSSTARLLMCSSSKTIQHAQYADQRAAGVAQQVQPRDVGVLELPADRLGAPGVRERRAAGAPRPPRGPRRPTLGATNRDAAGDRLAAAARPRPVARQLGVGPPQVDRPQRVRRDRRDRMAAAAAGPRRGQRRRGAATIGRRQSARDASRSLRRAARRRRRPVTRRRAWRRARRGRHRRGRPSARPARAPSSIARRRVASTRDRTRRRAGRRGRRRQCARGTPVDRAVEPAAAERSSVGTGTTERAASRARGPGWRPCRRAGP